MTSYAARPVPADPTSWPRVAPADPAEAAAFLAGRPLVVLTGAGLSTDSGIPDYRGPGSVARQPMTYADFLSGPRARQRYWARSHVGWSRMRTADPNPGHQALARLGPTLLVTQNVDGLHERAGSDPVVALHGRIADVVCLDCGTITPRADLQRRLAEANPGYVETHEAALVRPDGDVEIDDTDGFVMPACEVCGGVLKPDVVFFGETVPPARVERCFAAVEARADDGGALLVAGSSLAVMSGLRFVRRAARLGVPVVVVNRGTTRGDALATYKVEAGTSEWLQRLA